eukprot:g6389.t1
MEARTGRASGSPEGDRAALRTWRDTRGYAAISCWEDVQFNKAGRVEKLDLARKQIRSAFPRELCGLDACKELILYTNRLSGRLPARLGELRALEKLDCWDNFLEGHIPKGIAKLSALTELHLSGNFLSGPIPKELGKLRNLRALYLHGNKLSGEIPPALGDLKRLQKLVLINNRLTGAIPEGIGELALLEKLDLSQNALLMSGGGIPLSLRNHRNFRRFVFAVPANGAPIPPWRSKRSVAPALLLGYLDFFTDLGTVLSYRGSGLYWSFAVGLAFIVVPALCSGGFVFRQETPWWRGAASALQLGLLVEALISIKEESYSHALVALRVLEPLFQALPQLLLQAYILLVNREYLALRVVSVVASTFSLAMASTAIVAEHPLSQIRWARGVDYPIPRIPLASALIFATVPYVGSVIVRMGFRMHPQDFVWCFFFYQVMEIISRVLSVVVLAHSIRYYTFIFLAYMWFTRTCVALIHRGDPVGGERLRFRKLIRFSAAPIMDSVIDRVSAYKLCCFMTCLETVGCLAVGNSVGSSVAAEAALLSDLARRIYTVVAIFSMFGKIGLATAIVVPFKAKILEIVPPVNGELRVKDEAAAAKTSAAAAPTRPVSNTRGAPGGFGDGSGGPDVPLEKGLSIEDIMAVIDPDADAAGGDADDAEDMESGQRGPAGRTKAGAPVDEQESEKDSAWVSGGSGRRRLSKDGGIRGSGDDDGHGVIAAAASSSSRRLSLPTVEKGSGERPQTKGLGSTSSTSSRGGGGGRTTLLGHTEVAHEEKDEKSEDLAPSHGGTFLRDILS